MDAHQKYTSVNILCNPRQPRNNFTVKYFPIHGILSHSERETIHITHCGKDNMNLLYLHLLKYPKDKMLFSHHLVLGNRSKCPNIHYQVLVWLNLHNKYIVLCLSHTITE